MISRKLPYYEVAEGIFEIDEFDCVSIFVIVGSERALVVDTGTGIGDLKWVIENKITNKPYDIVVTHNHGDHIGGAGFFDAVWLHEADCEWESEADSYLQFRKEYAALIARREGKHYDYNLEKDISVWDKIPIKKKISDGQIFDLGNRKVTVWHCPGHTAGELVLIDDLTKTLFLGDACNCNLLLGKGLGKNPKEDVSIAAKGLERLLSMKEFYHQIYNAHHDFRGFGQTLYPSVLEDALMCYKNILAGTAMYIELPDPLFLDRAPKVFAEYGKVRISYIEGRIDEI